MHYWLPANPSNSAAESSWSMLVREKFTHTLAVYLQMNGNSFPIMGKYEETGLRVVA